MNKKTINFEEMNMLKEVLTKHRPSLLPLINSIGIIPLTDDQKEEIRGALADELIETGLDEYDEPNERGQLFEHLIDSIGNL